MKLVLFDIDGTLLNCGGLGIKALKRAMQKLYKKCPVFEESNLSGRTDLYNFSYVYKCLKGKKPTKAEIKKITAEYWAQLPREIAELKKAGKFKLMPGVKEFLDILKKYPQVKIALATGNTPQSAELKLKAAGLDKYFSFTYGGFGMMTENRQELLTLAVKSCEKHFKTKFDINDVFIVGDTHHDVIAAKENGYHNAVVLEGNLADKAKLLRAAAELEVKNFKDKELFLMWLVLKADPKGIKKGAYITPATAIEHVFFSRTGIDEDRLKMFKIKKYSDLESGKIW